MRLPTFLLVAFMMLTRTAAADSEPENTVRAPSKGALGGPHLAAPLPAPVATPLVFVTPQVMEGNPVSTAEIFNWRGYGCDTSDQFRVRHSSTVSAAAVPVYAQPGDRKPIRTLELRKGQAVAVLSERTITVPLRAYQVRASAHCPTSLSYCARGNCVDPDDVTVNQGQVIVPHLETPWRGYACDGHNGGQWICRAGNEWMRDTDMACLADALRPVTPTARPEEQHMLGWWLQTEDGWIRDDGQIALQVQCASKHATRRCVENGTDPASCRESPDALPWRTAHLDEWANVTLDSGSTTAPLCGPGLRVCTVRANE